MEQLALIIGKRIRSARRNAGLSQEKLAELAGVHPTYIGQLERGEKNATLESIYKVSSALDVPLSKLFELIDCSSTENKRNIPMECYTLISSKPKALQEQLLDIISQISDLSR